MINHNGITSKCLHKLCFPPLSRLPSPPPLPAGGWPRVLGELHRRAARPHPCAHRRALRQPVQVIGASILCLYLSILNTCSRFSGEDPCGEAGCREQQVTVYLGLDRYRGDQLHYSAVQYSRGQYSTIQYSTLHSTGTGRTSCSTH